MHKKVAKLDRDFHKFLALLGLTTQLRPSPSIEDADKARPSARQWRARGAAADPTGHGRRAREVSARSVTSRAKPRHRGAGCRRCVDALEFKSQATANARGGTRRRLDATGEWTSNGGTENTSYDEFPRVTESVQACARHGWARKATTHGRREDTTRDCGALRARYSYVEHKGAREDVKITPRALRNIVNRQRETGSAAALSRPGPPKVLTYADESVLARLSEELEGNYTWDEITKRFNEETGKDVCKLTVFRFCNSRG